MVAGMVVFSYLTGSVGLVGSLLGGTFAGTFGIITFIQARVPSARESFATVRVGIGLEPNNDGAFYMGGHVPGVATWDEAGTSLGWSSGYALPGIRKPPRVKAGNFRDIQMRHSDRNNGSPTYLAISASGDDAICISYITITEVSGNSRGWFGDIAAQCGGEWHYSAQIVGANNYRPKCVWISKDNKDDLTRIRVRTMALGIHLPDFSGDRPALVRQFQQYPDTMCGSQPRFSLYSEFQVGTHSLPIFMPTLQYTPDGADADLSKLNTRGDLRGRTGGVPIPWEPIVRSNLPLTTPATPSTQDAGTPGTPGTPGQNAGLPRVSPLGNPFLRTVLEATNPYKQPIPPLRWDPHRPSQLDPNDSTFADARPPPKKRVVPRTSTAGNQTQEYEDTIIVTNVPDHSTAELCLSPTSLGPSLVNTREGQFCDMASKTRWPVCKHSSACACLDLGSYTWQQDSSNGTANKNNTAPFLRACRKYNARDTSSSRAVPNRSFPKLIDWT